jgi:hypothetical protein
MKKLLLTIISIVLLGFTSFTQGSTCISTASVINACGTSFSGTNPPDGTLCGTHPCAQANFDCNTSTCPNCSTSGNDIQNSIENPLFWQFTSSVNCNYNISVTACNCAGGSGPCSGANFASFSANSSLPAGTITSYSEYSNFFGSRGGGACACKADSGPCCQTIAFTAAVTANQPFYMVFDGNAGSVCDFSIVVNPGSGCASCTILSSYDAYLKAELSKTGSDAYLSWYSLPDFNNGTYILERSLDGKNFSFLANINNVNPTGQTLYHTYTDYDVKEFGCDVVYYRLKSKSVDELLFNINSMIVLRTKRSASAVSSTKIFDVCGKEYSENNLPSGMIIYVTEFEDGAFETKKEYNVKK